MCQSATHKCGYAHPAARGHVSTWRGAKIRSASAVSLNFLTPLLRTHPRQSLLVRIAMGLAKLKIDEVDVAGKRVLIRVDFNVPQDKKDPSKITNTAR